MLLTSSSSVRPSTASHLTVVRVLALQLEGQRFDPQRELKLYSLCVCDLLTLKIIEVQKLPGKGVCVCV